MTYFQPPNNYRHSYSGSDAKAYLYFEGRGDQVVLLESLHTISWSVHEEKGDARALGYVGVKGFARAVRTVGGSLITTVIEDHPLAALMEVMERLVLEKDPAIGHKRWSLDGDLIGIGSGIDNTTFKRRLAPTLPPFNIFVQYVAEGSQWVRSDVNLNYRIPGAGVLIRGVELIDENLVTSSSDAVTEMAYSFKARDVKTISKQEYDVDPSSEEIAAREFHNFLHETEYNLRNSLLETPAKGTFPFYNEGEEG